MNLRDQAVARLRLLGFTEEQAWAMARAGLDVIAYVRVDGLLTLLREAS